VGSLFD